ncbi:YciI family protein [Aeromicrobium sp. P5_D10]
MRFVVLIHIDESHDAGAPSEAMFKAMEAFRANTSNGQIVGDGGLAPSSTATVWRVGDGKVTESDGPFAEAKEVIGGFFLVESPSAEAMAVWSRDFVDLHAEHWPGLSLLAEIREIATPPSQ